MILSKRNSRKLKALLAIILGAGAAVWLLNRIFPNLTPTLTQKIEQSAQQLPNLAMNVANPLHPLTIAAQKLKTYPGSQFVVEEELDPGSNYSRSIVSYQSEGLKIYALLTIPNGVPPEGGWPAIIFNHGYIPPEEYRTTERYVAYTDGFSRQGFVLLRPDYRGHGDSEGEPQGAYYSDAYLTDVMNAMASVEQMPEVNRERIGMWGHSMGGHLTLRSMVISDQVKAGVIWAGVVASHQDMINNWRRRSPWQPSPQEQQARAARPGRQSLIDQFGTPEENASFWDSISPIKFVSDISGPVQIHHGTADAEVPWEFSESLKNSLEAAGKPVEYYLYQGADHNLSGAAFSQAMNRSVQFFKANL